MMILRKSKNSKVLVSFSKYCLKHPEQRFWQALSNWSGKYIFANDKLLKQIDDTFYWEGKNK